MKFWIALIISIAFLPTKAQIAVDGSNNTKEFTVKNGQDVTVGGSNNDIVIYGNPRSVTVTGASHNICISGRVETLTIKGANADVWVGTLNKVIFNNSSANNNIYWVVAANSRRAPLLNDAGTNNDFHKAGKIKCTGNESREEDREDQSGRGDGEDESWGRNTDDDREDCTKTVVINVPPIITRPRSIITVKRNRGILKRVTKSNPVPKRRAPVVVDAAGRVVVN
jgi:hypothetical protein